MRLVHCRRISDVGLSAAVRNFPQLEDVEISFNILSDVSLEVLGQCCPLLKSLKFARMLLEPCGYGIENMVAFVIAETMPGLRHLNIAANKLTNDGLHAILDACPLLESLDIEACNNLNLTGRLGRRCWKQIKYLRLPIQYSDYFYSYNDNNISDSDSLSDEDIYYTYDSDSDFN
jgi:F-box/leucine-rich repeat protein 2/20